MSACTWPMRPVGMPASAWAVICCPAVSRPSAGVLALLVGWHWLQVPPVRIVPCAPQVATGVLPLPVGAGPPPFVLCLRCSWSCMMGLPLCEVAPGVWPEKLGARGLRRERRLALRTPPRPAPGEGYAASAPGLRLVLGVATVGRRLWNGLVVHRAGWGGHWPPLPSAAAGWHPTAAGVRAWHAFPACCVLWWPKHLINPSLGWWAWSARLGLRPGVIPRLFGFAGPVRLLPVPGRCWGLVVVVAERVFGGDACAAGVAPPGGGLVAGGVEFVFVEGGGAGPVVHGGALQCLARGAFL